MGVEGEKKLCYSYKIRVSKLKGQMNFFFFLLLLLTQSVWHLVLVLLQTKAADEEWRRLTRRMQKLLKRSKNS